MKKSELKRLVEERVNEAWYNNKADFARGLGKVALGAGITAGTLAAMDRGLENNYQYQQELNRQAAHNSQYGEEGYNRWCDNYHMDPDDKMSLEQYNEFLHAQEEGMNEKRERRTFWKDGEDPHAAYKARLRDIDSIVRSTMRNLARSVKECIQECKAELYRNGVSDADKLTYVWERKILDAIFLNDSINKFLIER